MTASLTWWSIFVDISLNVLQYIDVSSNENHLIENMRQIDKTNEHQKGWLATSTLH